MRVAIDTFMAERIYGHVPLCSGMVLDKLAGLEPKNEYMIITAHPEEYQKQTMLPNVHVHTVRCRPRQGLVTQHQLQLPGILEGLCPDVLHVEAGVAPIGWKGPLVITAHGVADVDVRQTPHAQRYQRQLMQESLRRTQRIIVSSEQAAAEMASRWSIPQERICVVAEATDVEVQARALLLIYQSAIDCSAQALSPGSTLHTAEASREASPMVSVVIPFSRVEMIEYTLEAVMAQSYSGALEVIVVGPHANALTALWPIIPFESGPICEPGRVRNLGAAQARGEVLLFLDDDVIVAKDWVEKNVHALQELPRVGIVGARIVGRSSAFFSRCIDFTNYGHYQHSRPSTGPVGSSSMGITRSVFYVAGGFDEALCSGEDIDLCYRVQKQGYRCVYRPDISVIHDHKRTTLRMLLQYNYAHGLAGGLTVKARYRDSSLKNTLLYTLRFPPLFLLLIPVFAFFSMLHIVLINILDHKRVLLYAPFVFLGKLAYEFGVFMTLVVRT